MNFEDMPNLGRYISPSRGECSWSHYETSVKGNRDTSNNRDTSEVCASLDRSNTSN